MGILMKPSFHWSCFPDVFLLEILQYLPAKDLAAAAQVNKYWNDVAKNEKFWKIRLEKDFLFWNVQPKIFESFCQEYLYFINKIPRVMAEKVDDFYYSVTKCQFSIRGTYLVVTGIKANFCLYFSDPLEFLFERSLEEGLNWKSIEAIQFSPDEQKILLSGIRDNDAGELAVYSIEANSHEVHFLCRIPSSPSFFHGCWFNSDHLIIGEFYPFGFRSPIASSITHFYLCSLPKYRNGSSDFYPFIRVLNRNGEAKWPIIVDYVSPRFRRIIQMTKQAKEEGKSLSEKIDELHLQPGTSIDGDLTELKKILDLEEQCFHCYLKHQLTKEEYGGNIECFCICHERAHRLLIYVSGASNETICFKLIDNEMMTETMNMKRYCNAQNEEHDEWSFILRRTDEPDHQISIHSGSIEKIEVTPDEKTMFLLIKCRNFDLNEEELPIDFHYEIRCIDLEKMILDPMTCCAQLKTKEMGGLASSDRIVTSFTSDEIVLWSRHYRGIPVRRLQTGGLVSSISLHPEKDWIAVTTGEELRIWKQQEIV